ncbi:hypothetical protein ACJRO7_026575 [Eucalyptus globulus]|uniref:ATP phosphoribosyltransferase n=1 Tax=Eucalyptus globulus TaxID=34317 RepID=A0ABD3JPG4_EUCGL
MLSLDKSGISQLPTHTQNSHSFLLSHLLLHSLKLQAPEASHAVPTASTSMPLVSPSQQLLLPSSDMPSSVSGNPSASPRIVCCSGSSPSTVTAPGFNGRQDSERREIRLGLPSNRRMVDQTLSLLKDCRLPVERDSPQQHVATIPELPNLQVFFQHSEEIVRNLSSGHLDIGIAGFDTVSECGQGNEDLIIVHDALGYGDCRLCLAIPKTGIYEKINSVKELAQMSQWTEVQPLRVATGFEYLGKKFMQENGPKPVSILTARGPLEAAPAIGTADVILNLVSCGTILGDNNLKELEGGTALESQAVLVASRKSLIQREDVRDTTREILERLEAHLKAVSYMRVTAYMSGSSVEEITERILSQPSLFDSQNPAVCQVFCQRDGKMVVDCYAIDICVPEKALYSSVQQLRAMGSSRVLISPLTPRWQQLLAKLGL